MASNAEGDSDSAKIVGFNAARDMMHNSSGYELVGIVVIFAGGGIWLDHLSGLGPWFTISLSLLGVFGAFIHLYYRYIAILDSDNRATAVDNENKTATLGPSDTSRNPRP